MHADARRRRHLELAVRPFPRVGELGTGSFDLHEYFMRSAVQKLALLRQDKAARMTMKQRDAQLGFERGNLSRYRRLREPELFAGVREASGLGGGVEDLELVP